MPYHSTDGANRGRRTAGAGCSPRLIMALGVLAFAVVSYYTTTRVEENPYTGETQRLALSVPEEVALGLHAAPRMIEQHGGELPLADVQRMIDEIGHRLVTANRADEANDEGDWKFDFHVLADRKTINAFALPGGQIFITAALLDKLRTPSGELDPNQIAGVLGHEIGHVVARHSSQQMAKAKLFDGISMAAVLATSDGSNPESARLGQMVGAVLSMKYGRDHESQSDELGVKFLHQAGFDPRGLLRVMLVLREASGSGGPPEFLSTHPDPGNRLEAIAGHIRALGLEPTGYPGT